MFSTNPITTPSPANIHSLVAQASTPIDKEPIKKAIDMLNYFPLHARPNITLITNILSQFTNRLMLAHWNLEKEFLRYFHGTRDLGLNFTKSEIHEQLPELIGCADSNYGKALVKKSQTKAIPYHFFKIQYQSIMKSEFISMKNFSKEMR
ncbi:hypothetical protein O181_018290 [Austropuccinia psidii MF-1]|uniref:Uncharacterized protein n=1 Tax=Austropuccinia psidii MF-1 TaxID=1389203 RepID=A0A9Q3C9K3_9BASI|nr:hypothetical protein [Austropuccinia psidii MF-1]